MGYRVEQNNSHYPGTAKVVVYYDELLADNDKILNSDIPYQSVIESIQAAKKYLSDPQNIDIANSILSSIKAVKGYLKGYFKSHGKNPATLDDCIKELQKQKVCPEEIIIKPLKSLYIYRHRTENVAHGSPLTAELSNEDALLCNEMAISLINYFHRKFTVSC
ncbi:hypothetical protein [Nostoc piscinale]|uniref:hypothetical protein n=1 Tax=Nostoc piscinale TaxID=224012 RepID=UPI0011873D84|nr:hypothetical protein [Nostoc piscinale]